MRQTWDRCAVLIVMYDCCIQIYELVVLNMFIFNMLAFQYVWKYIISVIGASRLARSLSSLSLSLSL